MRRLHGYSAQGISMADLTWNQLSESDQERVRRLGAAIDVAFQDFVVPVDLAQKINSQQAFHEAQEVQQILGTIGWEHVDRDLVMSAINNGVAIIHLCNPLLFGYFVPLFMSLALREAFIDGQDEMFVESLLHRMLGMGANDPLDWSVYLPHQNTIIEEFILLCSEIFCNQ